MTTYSSILAWGISWTEDPGGGLKELAMNERTHAHVCMHTHTHTLTHTRMSARTHTHSLSLCLCLCLSLSRMHTHSLSHTHTHTLLVKEIVPSGGRNISHIRTFLFQHTKIK